MMAIAFKTKREAKDNLPFGEERIIETSLFGKEFKDGIHSVVVSTQPDKIRNSFAQITVRNGQVVKLI